MKYVIWIEIALCALLFAGGAYSSFTAKSADEGIIAAPLYLGGGVMIVVTFATLFVWWMWQVTFRG